ncbi:S9 family peptidase [Pseudactinotalea sp. HY158]|uniref:alpha/beta hydrolase family protein n=1 Tax=Pseudactinotalea sp. HY158 TaxID=2654547 RepID=UPI00129C5367|nr:acyl-CoA thioester hydrolase/BAAT C-terminal domain-containing protein [Pseudactinotalea sp. HY158]QGH69549.1 alpha/beta hydrolase [Pseudactinotalea sp. HY158]
MGLRGVLGTERTVELRTGWQRFWPVALTSLVVATILGVSGALAGPRWAPTEMHRTIIPTTADVRIGGTEQSPVGTYTVRVEPIRIDLGEVTVDGLLFLPEGAPAGPGVVFMHGAGTGEPEAFAPHGQALASAGIRVLVPAKRLDDYSTRERNYPSMAQDYLVSWRYLRERVPGVDPDRVGFYAESEGAWIAPIAAADEPDVAFLMLISAPVVPPREQAAFATANYLRNTHVPRGVFRAIPRALGAQIPGGGFEYVDFDVLPYLRQVDVPVLMAYGTDDASMPIVQGALIVIDTLAAHGNDAVTVRYFDGADHGLMIDEQLAPGFTTVLSSWTLGLPATASAPPQIAGDRPEQEYRAAAVPSPAWFASGDMLVWSIIGSFLLVVAGLGLGAVSLVRRRSPAAAVGRLAVAAGLAALAVVTTFVAYIAQIATLAMNYHLDDTVVIGGWILVQLLGIFAVVVGVVSVRAAMHARRAGTYFTVTDKVSWWATHVGSLALLLVAAYWGVFPAVG